VDARLLARRRMHMQRWLDSLRALGGVDLEVAALTRRFRAGELSLERLLLAASLGHDAAAQVAVAAEPVVTVHAPTGDLVLEPGQRVCVGRGAHNDVRLDDGRVSSLHCTLERKGAATVQVRDLGSRNGTRLNGEPFQGKTTAHAGDELCVGRAGTLWVDVRWPGVPALDLLDVGPDRERVGPDDLSPPLLDQLVAELDESWPPREVDARPDPWCRLIEGLGAEAETRIAVAAAAAVASTWERDLADEPSFSAWVPASVAAMEAWLRCPCEAHLEAARRFDDPARRREPPSTLPTSGGVHRAAHLDRRAAAYVAMVGPRERADPWRVEDPWRSVRSLRRAVNAAAFCLGPARLQRALRDEVAPWVLGYGDPLQETARGAG
jgi:hypothetical protein